MKRTLKDFKKIYEGHIGHTVRYFYNGNGQNFSVLKRVTINEELGDVELWVDNPEKDSVFPRKLFSESALSCDCGKA